MLPFIILGAVNAYIFLNTGKKVEQPDQKGKGMWTVYGTTWCGWTTKQLEYLKRKVLNTNSSIAKKANATELMHFQLWIHQMVKESLGTRKFN